MYGAIEDFRCGWEFLITRLIASFAPTWRVQLECGARAYADILNARLDPSDSDREYGLLKSALLAGTCIVTMSPCRIYGRGHRRSLRRGRRQLLAEQPESLD